MTTLQYAIAPVSALLGIIIGAVINGLGSRRTLDRQLAHEDARIRAERFLDRRRDLYARAIAQHDQRRDLDYKEARERASKDALPSLTTLPRSDQEDGSPQDDEVLQRQLELKEAHIARAQELLEINVAQRDLVTARYRLRGEISLVSPSYVQLAFSLLLLERPDDIRALANFIQAAQLDLNGSAPPSSLTALEQKIDSIWRGGNGAADSSADTDVAD